MEDAVGVFLDNLDQLLPLGLLVGDLIAVHLGLVVDGVLLFDLLLHVVGLLALHLPGDDLPLEILPLVLPLG